MLHTPARIIYSAAFTSWLHAVIRLAKMETGTLSPIPPAERLSTLAEKRCFEGGRHHQDVLAHTCVMSRCTPYTNSTHTSLTLPLTTDQDAGVCASLCESGQNCCRRRLEGHLRCIHAYHSQMFKIRYYVRRYDIMLVRQYCLLVCNHISRHLTLRPLFTRKFSMMCISIQGDCSLSF